MKKILLLAVLFICSVIFSQEKRSDNFWQIMELKKDVENIYKNDSLNIKSYVKNYSNGKIYSLKVKDVYDQYGDMTYESIYQIIKKDDNIVYIKHLQYYWAEGMPFNDTTFHYFFNKEKRLIGATKTLEILIYSAKNDKSFNMHYQIDYALSKITNKLERINESFTDDDKSPISLNSEKYKDDKKYILKVIKNLKSITVNNLEDFMKTEKIKYYK